MISTTRVTLDRIASSTRNARLAREVVVSPEIVAREGYVVAVRILDDKATYNVVEDPAGRLVPLRAGDVLAGTLGSRRALRGYAGEVPERLKPRETIEVLNLGGVLGRCTSVNPDLGPPFRAEVLGAILAFPALGDRVGRPAHIGERALPPAERLSACAPIVYVSGTAMDAGKTVASAEIVRGLTRVGARVAACKLTGVALLRDALAMEDAGAIVALTFNDAGRTTTSGREAVPVARGVLNRLALARPDVVVAELGDGILGDYGVQEILADPELMAAGAAHVLCATDPVGCWGAVEIFRREYGLAIAVVSGPVTDNQVGRAFVEEALGVPAHNARHDAAGLVAALRRELAGAAEASATAAAVPS